MTRVATDSRFDSPFGVMENMKKSTTSGVTLRTRALQGVIVKQGRDMDDAVKILAPAVVDLIKNLKK